MKDSYSLSCLFGGCIFLAIGLSIIPIASSYAAVPQLINYQGKLTKASGAPVDTTIQMVFTIYADSGGTTSLWTETQSSVAVDKGVFNVLLGSVVPVSYSVFDGSARYLGVKVGGDPEITPRKPLVSVPHAFKSLEADTADYALAAPSVSDNDWVINGDKIYHLTGNVGIGTTSPNEQLEIAGNLAVVRSTDTTGIIKMGADRFIHNYGTGNTFVGINAGNLTMTGYGGNTADGYYALAYNTTGYSNTATGHYALNSNTTGHENTANGYAALRSNTTGFWNTAGGYGALFWNTTGYCNTAGGYGALYSNTEGFSNTANGYGALFNNTTGNFNTANGYMALTGNSTGHYNTANGHQALVSNTTGYENTANGDGALGFNTTGLRNTANGKGALYSNTTGSNNTALGFRANVSSGDLTNATAIGNGAVVDASNKVRIGNTDVTSIGGQVDWTAFSDGRYKKNTSQNVPGLAFISKLKPVTYTMDVEAIDAALRPPRQLREGQSQDDLMPSAEEMASKQAQSQIVYTGFIAQEVEQAAQEVGYDFSGVDAPKSDQGMYGLRYAEFVVPLVKAMQEQQQLIQEQRQMIQDLQKRIEELEKK